METILYGVLRCLPFLQNFGAFPLLFLLLEHIHLGMWERKRSRHLVQPLDYWKVVRKYGTSEFVILFPVEWSHHCSSFFSELMPFMGEGPAREEIRICRQKITRRQIPIVHANALFHFSERCGFDMTSSVLVSPAQERYRLLQFENMCFRTVVLRIVTRFRALYQNFA